MGFRSSTLRAGSARKVADLCGLSQPAKLQSKDLRSLDWLHLLDCPILCNAT